MKNYSTNLDKPVEFAENCSVNSIPGGRWLFWDGHNECSSIYIWDLWPGFCVSRMVIDSGKVPVGKAPCVDESGRMLFFNYCISGRSEVHVSEDSFHFVNPNDLAMSRQPAKGNFIYPEKHYTGVELFINVDVFSNFCRTAPNSPDFPVEDLEVIIEKYALEKETFVAQMDASVHGVISKLNKACLNYSCDEMKVHVASLVKVMAKSYRKFMPHRERYYSGAQVKLAKSVEEMMNSNLAVSRSVKDMAWEMSVSIKNLRNSFKGVYGCSVEEYLHGARMKKAALLLDKSTKTIHEITMDVGYLGEKRFCRDFVRAFGVEPLEYRQRCMLMRSSGSKNEMFGGQLL